MTIPCRWGSSEESQTRVWRRSCTILWQAYESGQDAGLNLDRAREKLRRQRKEVLGRIEEERQRREEELKRQEEKMQEKHQASDGAAGNGMEESEKSFF